MRTRALLLAALLAAGTAACQLPGGEGPNAALTASPNPLVLETVVGGQPDVGSVRITNVGTVPTAPLDVSSNGLTPSADGCDGTVLDPSEFCDITFTYAPATGRQALSHGVVVTGGLGVVTVFRVEADTYLAS